MVDGHVPETNEKNQAWYWWNGYHYIYPFEQCPPIFELLYNISEDLNREISFITETSFFLWYKCLYKSFYLDENRKRGTIIKKKWDLASQRVRNCLYNINCFTTRFFLFSNNNGKRTVMFNDILVKKNNDITFLWWYEWP